MPNQNLAQFLQAGLHISRRTDKGDRRHCLPRPVVNRRRDPESHAAPDQVRRNPCLLDLVIFREEPVHQFRFVRASTAQVGLALGLRPRSKKGLPSCGDQERTANVRSRLEAHGVIAPRFRDVDKVVAGLNAQEDRHTRVLMQRRQIFVRHETGADVATRERETVQRGTKIEAVLVLIEPTFGDEATNEAVNRTLRCAQGAHELSERHAGVINHLFEDLRDPIDGAVVLRVRFRLYSRPILF